MKRLCSLPPSNSPPDALLTPHRYQPPPLVLLVSLFAAAACTSEGGDNSATAVAPTGPGSSGPATPGSTPETSPTGSSPAVGTTPSPDTQGPSTTATPGDGAGGARATSTAGGGGTGSERPTNSGGADAAPTGSPTSVEPEPAPETLPDGGVPDGGAGPYVPPVEPCEIDTSTPTLSVVFCPMGPFEANPIPAELVPEPAPEIDGGIGQPQQPVVQSETLCSGFEWAEGPVWFAETGTLYFSHFDVTAADEYYNGTIVQWRDGEGCTDFLTDTGTNGLARGVDGNLVAGRHINRTLSHFNISTGEACSLVDNFEGSALSSPNDLAIRSDGHIYFSDPSWNLGPRTQELPESLYHLAPDGTLALIEAFEGQDRPNGVSLSPDETRLYVAVSRNILEYAVAPDGSVSGGTTFVSGESADGMAVDCAGNLYTSGGRIYSPAGELLGRFAGGTNLAFGGPEGKTLFIVGRGELSFIELNIPGLPY